MPSYPVQRQRLPESAILTSSSVGDGFLGEERGRGDQHPGRAEAALDAAVLEEGRLQRGERVALARPSTVVISLPSACSAR